jgi:hypothetical protein
MAAKDEMTVSANAGRLGLAWMVSDLVRPFAAL